MNLRLATPLLVAGLLAAGHAAPHGLAFAGNDRPIDRRTSYDVFGGDGPPARQRFSAAFELSLNRSTDLGYIFRVKEGESGRIFNLFFDGQGPGLYFRLNEEGKSGLASLEIPREVWPDGEWRAVEVVFDVAGDRIAASVAGRAMEARGVGLAGRFVPSLVFGRSDHIIDVPSFAVRALAVTSDSRRHTFALDEYEGGVVRDATGRVKGAVANPRWLIREAWEWQRVGEFSSPSVAAAVFDAEAGAVHYLNAEQITTLDVRTGTHTVRRFASACPVPMTQGTCFVAGGRIYVYEVFGAAAVAAGAEVEGAAAARGLPTVASCDLETLVWRAESRASLPTRLHHHASWLDPASGRYTIFGGFGEMHYSRAFHSFDLASGEWRTLPEPRGDRIEPRYFSSLGVEGEGTVLVFGGMGNESGEQTVGRRYFYDLHRVDPRAGTSRRLWSVPWEGGDVVPVRSMAVAEGYFYTLLYPEYISDSRLELHRFSIADGTHERMGAPLLPIHSDKINTNANLYHDPRRGRLYALVQEFEDDIASRLRVYTLAFPPVTAERLAELRGETGRRTNVVVVALLALLVVGAAFAMVRFRLGPGARTAVEAEGERVREKPGPNSIWLFGPFAAYDVRGRDVSYMFSTLLRRMFCLVLEHTERGGISSRLLSDLLWPDKAEEKVKNLRNVSIHHLRKVLSEFSGVELRYDEGRFRIVVDEEFRCDVLCVQRIVRSGVTGADRGRLLDIVGRGKFLRFADSDPLFDDFKSSVERMLEPVLAAEMRRSFEAGDYLATIEVAEALFHIDPLDDNALRYTVDAMNRLRMRERAITRQREFAAEFRRATGNDYR